MCTDLERVVTSHSVLAALGMLVLQFLNVKFILFRDGNDDGC